MAKAISADELVVRRERWKLVAYLIRLLEVPMLVLSAVWVVLLVTELTRGLVPWMQQVSTAIWLAFVVQFALEFLIAPSKGTYLRKHWITAISLAVPAFRLLRLARVARAMRAAQIARASRGVRLVRVLGSMNRGMRALALTMRRRGASYVVALTLLVAFTGAAGMYTFEREAGGFPDYATALWWTAMLLTTMGSDYWPQSPEGRVLCLLLAVYAFAVFGYVTAAIAAYFVNTDARTGAGGEPRRT